jgi:hypothetical protein
MYHVLRGGVSWEKGVLSYQGYKHQEVLPSENMYQ